MKNLILITLIVCGNSAIAAMGINCQVDFLKIYAIKHSLLTEVKGEEVAHLSSIFNMSDVKSTTYIADLVSYSGFREVQYLVCDNKSGIIASHGRGILSGKVVFEPEVSKK